MYILHGEKLKCWNCILGDLRLFSVFASDEEDNINREMVKGYSDNT